MHNKRVILAFSTATLHLLGMSVLISPPFYFITTHCILRWMCFNHFNGRTFNETTAIHVLIIVLIETSMDFTIRFRFILAIISSNLFS